MNLDRELMPFHTLRGVRLAELGFTVLKVGL